MARPSPREAPIKRIAPAASAEDVGLMKAAFSIGAAANVYELVV
jgi:hypothetical protein